jgi:hypothetical protein
MSIQSISIAGIAIQESQTTGPVQLKPVVEHAIASYLDFSLNMGKTTSR